MKAKIFCRRNFFSAHLATLLFALVIVLWPWARAQSQTLLASQSATAATLAAMPRANGTQLNGLAVPNGVPTTDWFQWGVVGDNYPSNTTVQAIGSGTAVMYVTNVISAVLPGVAYHYRLAASNELGVVFGAPQYFGSGLAVSWGNSFQLGPPIYPTNVTAIAASGTRNLALKLDGTVAALTTGGTPPPANATNIVAIAVGTSHDLALQGNGSVIGWGSDGFGEINIPAHLTNVVALAAGYSNSLALKADGTLVAWGTFYFGQTNYLPTGLTNVVAIAAGAYNNLALKANGTVTAWGYNFYGQTNVPASLTNIVAIAAGAGHNLALRANGTVVAWGNNINGQATVPAGLSNVVAIAAGANHSVALKADGTVVAWGSNLFDGTNIPASLNNVVAIAGGLNFSAALTVNVNTATTLMASTNSLIFGQTLTLTSFVQPSLSGSFDSQLGGLVTLYDNGASVRTNTVVPQGTNLLGMVEINRLNPGTGSHSYIAVFSNGNYFGASTSAVMNVVVNQASTTNILFSTLNPATFGQAATIVDTINAVAPGAGIPTGTVVFYDGGTILGTNSVIARGNEGIASWTLVNPGVGNHNLTAVYSGDTNFTGGTSTITQVVKQAGTSISLASLANPSVYGQPVKFEVLLGVLTPDSGPPPTGSLTLYEGNTVLDTSTLGSTNSPSVSSFAPGSHVLTVVYSGDANYLSSTSGTIQVVYSANTTNWLVSVINPVVFGQPALFKANIGAVAPGAGVPTGSVIFYNGTNSFATNTLVNGSVCATNAAVTVGTNMITAVYSGDTNFNGSVSLVLNEVVNPTETTNILVSSSNPSALGQPISLTATVDPVAPGAGTPTGMVIFYQGATGFATNPLVNGLASVTNVVPPSGTNFYTAVYSGDTNFNGSTSAAIAQSVLSLTNAQALTNLVVIKTGARFDQTGLMQQQIVVSNFTALTCPAICLTFHLSLSDQANHIVVDNATGMDTNGNPIMQYNFPIPPFTSVTFEVEYYVPNRTTLPTPTITVDLVVPQTNALPSGTAQTIIQTALLSPDQAALIGFASVKNATYYILYSSDLIHWTAVQPPMTGNGSEMQWLDQGPPGTQSSPGSQPRRFYRVIKTP
jgi:hypothetical protein